MYLRRFWRAFRRKDTGISLVESAVALALVGVIGVGFLAALGTSSNSRAIADEQVASRLLAESVMENIKQAEFAASYTVNATLLEEYSGYAATANVTSLGTGIQKITVTVNHRNRDVHVLEGYKVDR